MQGQLIAIYVRTNQNPGSVSQYRNITAQVEQCLEFAKEKGYSENDIHIYKDEGVSGVAKRFPAQDRFLAVITNYGVLITSGMSRIARNQKRIDRVYNAIKDAGIIYWVCSYPNHPVLSNGVSGFFSDQQFELLKQAYDEEYKKVLAAERKRRSVLIQQNLLTLSR